VCVRQTSGKPAGVLKAGNLIHESTKSHNLYEAHVYKKASRKRLANDHAVFQDADKHSVHTRHRRSWFARCAPKL
jgi:hypothetical protein